MPIGVSRFGATGFSSLKWNREKHRCVHHFSAQEVNMLQWSNTSDKASYRRIENA